jgi:acetolactate synthase-1/2/3 large subunit
MTKLNGGQALIQSLQHAGIRLVVGIPGQGQYEAVDALYGAPGMRYLSVRNEQATSYIADAYARTSGEIAAVLVVQGPGFLNAAGGVATAYAASSPMLVITGDQHLDRKQSSAPAGNTASVWAQGLGKWAARVTRPAEIPGLVQEAVYQLRSGRPQPVVLEIAPQVFAASEKVQLAPPRPVTPVAPDGPALHQAVQRLTQAEKPVIWVGAGAQRAGAWVEVQTLAEHLQAPVVSSRQGKGVLSERHPLSLGLAELRYPPLRTWLAECDLIIAIGVSANVTAFGQPVVQIDVDPAQIREGAQVCPLVGDARQLLLALWQAMQPLLPARTAQAAAVQREVQQLKAARFAPDKQLQPQWALMQAMRAALPDDVIVVQGMTQMGYYSRNYFPVYAPRSFVTPSSLATLGCEGPLALGAKLAHPGRPVVAICGDGGFLYNSQELITAAQYGIHPVLVVFNDNAYGNVLRAQMEQFDGRLIGTELRNPDFVKLAEAYGVRGVRAQDADKLEKALREALSIDLATVIEVPVGRMQREY